MVSFNSAKFMFPEQLHSDNSNIDPIFDTNPHLKAFRKDQAKINALRNQKDKMKNAT